MKHTSSTLILLVLIISFTTSVFSQSPETQLKTADSRNVLFRKLEEVMKKEHIPGLMISIVKGDSIVYAGGLGYADLKSKIAVSQNTLFHHHSITKMFTAMGILKLVHDGKLKLQDELKKIAPELEFKNKWESTHPVKVIHLLEHTAGFDDVHLNNMYSNKLEKHRGLEAAMLFRNSYISRWKPGERMSYSNPDYIILGYLIEKFSGKTYSSFIKEYIFNPVKMHNASCELKIQYPGKYATGYIFSKNGYFSYPYNFPAGTGSGSALKANALDMARFVHFFINNWYVDSAAWLPQNYLEQMETVHSTLAAKNGLKLGYAFANEKFPNNSKVTFRGHFGGDSGFESLVLYNREHKIGYALSNNGYKKMGALSRLIEEYLTADLPVVPQQLKTISLDRNFDSYIGYYQFLNPRSERWNFLSMITNGFKLKRSGDELILSRLFGRADTLFRVKGSLFRRKNELEPYYVFGKDDEGNLFFQGVRNEYYQKTAYFPVLVEQLFLVLTSSATLLSLILALATLIAGVIKKSKLDVIEPVILPILAFASGFLAYRTITYTDHFNKLAFNDINISSTTIFLGSSGFAVFIVWAIFQLYKGWNTLKSRWIRLLLCFNLAVLGSFTIYLALHGWIGIRVWAL